MPQWRLTEEFLLEEREGAVYLWGRWDREFGRWSESGQAAAPAGSLLGRLGIWQEPGGERDDAWYASRAALAGYWSIIPASVRLQASQQGGCQWEALMEFWRKAKLGQKR